MARPMLVGATLAAALFATASVRTKEFSATFSGFNEVGALNAETAAILSEGTGTPRP
jgi:hypothetical protein